MALTKVSTAMFDTAAQSSDLNIDANTLFVDVSTNRVGIGTTSPSVPLEVSGQLKAGGILYPTSDGSNGQALVTNGSGVASFATVAPTAGTGVTVSGTTVSIGQAVATSSNVTFNDLVVAGTLTVNGATNTNSATNTTIEDILIELGTGTSGSPANDAGLVLERGSSDNVFIGWDESADTFTVGTGSFTGASSGNLTITPATAVFGGLTVDTSTLVVDASNNRVGIGNASPDVSLDIGSFTDAVHVPAGTTAQRPGSPAAGYFRYNSTLQKFEGYTTAWGEIGGGGSNTFTTDVFTGDGAEDDFTLSQSVSSVNDLIVFIDGVYQVPTAAYTVSGTTLTMTAAPANTRKIVAYSVKHMVSGSNINQNSFTGNGIAVAFTLATAPVNENNTQVFLDGVYQHKATYATSGTTLTFDTAPASGVAIEVMVFTQTEINVPVDGTITTVKLAADAVTSAKIADDAVGADQLASNAVVTASIVNDAVTADKIADNIALPGNITTTGTLAPTGVLTANAGVVVDNITIDGNEIDVSSGNLTLDVAGDMTLDAGGNNFNFAIGGTAKGMFSGSGDSFAIMSKVPNGDLIFQGNDGGSTITALTLDMSEAGEATFSGDVKLNDSKVLRFGNDQDFRISFNGTNAILQNVTGDSDISFVGKDNTTEITALTLDMSEAGAATFNAGATFGSSLGIGTVSPVMKMHVKGATGDVPSNDSNPPANGIAIFDSGGGYSLVIGTDDSNTGSAWIQSQSANVSSSEYDLLLNPNGGDVGIGTTNPTSKLDVRDTATATVPLRLETAGGSANTVRPQISMFSQGSNGYHISTIRSNVSNDPYGLVFTENTTERMRINSTGNLVFPDGKGIDFSATGDVTGSGSEVLHDYEEGIWGSTITGSVSGSMGLTSNSDHLAYTKIGRQVTCTGYLGIVSDSSVNGAIRFSLPYACDNLADDAEYSMSALGVVNNGSTIGGMKFVFTFSGSHAYLYRVLDDGTADYIKHTDVDTNFQLMFNFSYFAAT